jgi:hypothetical protein
VTGQRPFELTKEELAERLDEMVDATVSDLVSEFVLMPQGNAFLEYPEFRDAYEVLKRHTTSFEEFTEERIGHAMHENARAIGVLRAILGMTPPEWGELVRTERESDVTQGAGRTIDRECRKDVAYIRDRVQRYEARAETARRRGRPIPERPKTLERIDALVGVAVEYISRGAPTRRDGVIHRLAKFDTSHGLESLRYAAREHIPFALLLYERYLGRPFATHRDSVSELVGEVMESAVARQLDKSGVTYRRTGRAERIPGFGQAPDFCVPDEVNPVAVIEAKITSDDGTARDKVSRIVGLVNQRNRHIEDGHRPYEVVACLDGRGFRVRARDMRELLVQLDGKVFTTATLDQLCLHTAIHGLVKI